MGVRFTGDSFGMGVRFRGDNLVGTVFCKEVIYRRSF